MAKRVFDHLGYPCEPVNLGDKFWFYAQKEGMVCCSYTRGNPTEIAIIPWRIVKRALSDREKAKGRRRAVGEARKP